MSHVGPPGSLLNIVIQMPRFMDSLTSEHVLPMLLEQGKRDLQSQVMSIKCLLPSVTHVTLAQISLAIIYIDMPNFKRMSGELYFFMYLKVEKKEKNMRTRT